MHISLIGLPGSGKSSVGRLLATRLRRPLVDVDQVFEERQGIKIRQFFELHGESVFRDHEQALLAELISQNGPPCILSTGGGCVTREPNRRLLQDQTLSIYLRASPDEIFRRLRRDTQRPLLQVGNPLLKLQELFAQRDPLYNQTAHFVVATHRQSASKILNHIVMQLELSGAITQAAQPGL